MQFSIYKSHDDNQTHYLQWIYIEKNPKLIHRTVNISFSNKFSTWEATLNPKGETFSKSNKYLHLLKHQLQHQNEHKHIKMPPNFKTETPQFGLLKELSLVL